MPRSQIEILTELNETYKALNAILQKHNDQLTKQNAAFKTQHKHSLSIIDNLESQVSLRAKIIETQQALLTEYHAAPNHIADQLRHELDQSRKMLGAVLETTQNQKEKQEKAEQALEQQSIAIENLRQKVAEQKDNERRAKFEQKKPQR